MVEVRLALSVEAMQAIAAGNELAIDAGDGLRVFLSCDDAAITTFRDRIEKAMLHLLPVSNTLN